MASSCVCTSPLAVLTVVALLDVVTVFAQSSFKTELEGALKRGKAQEGTPTRIDPEARVGAARESGEVGTGLRLTWSSSHRSVVQRVGSENRISSSGG